MVLSSKVYRFAFELFDGPSKKTKRKEKKQRLKISFVYYKKIFGDYADSKDLNWKVAVFFSLNHTWRFIQIVSDVNRLLNLIFCEIKKSCVCVRACVCVCVCVCTFQCRFIYMYGGLKF